MHNYVIAALFFCSSLAVSAEKIENVVGSVVDAELKGFKEIFFGVSYRELDLLGFKCELDLRLGYYCQGNSLETGFTLLGQETKIRVSRGHKIGICVPSLSPKELYDSFEQVYGKPSLTHTWWPSPEDPPWGFEVRKTAYWVFRNGALISATWYPKGVRPPECARLEYLSPETVDHPLSRIKAWLKSNGLDIEKMPINLKDL